MNLHATDRNIVARNAGQLTAGKDKRTDKKTEQSRRQKEKKKKRTSTLADQNKQARACGLSYGKYVAQKYAPVVREKNIHCSEKENIKTYGKG